MEDAQPPEGHEDTEVVDGVVVLSGARAIEPTPQPSPPQRRQVVAVAATGFVAGAATAAVVGRYVARRAARVAASPSPAPVVGVVVASRRIVAVRG